ncbi:hypothetical protein JCM17845_16920 [Iodidimonas gelatinilytica]|uniref:Uncharacterized protein n=1 Tax=Iodidimonas gelatinilytica TaxID=1236966 RepID=A0A5A7N1P0_9PROT|nr:hypothetical protein [Iodidimonas gelatinilytica]GER01069.1 hypothetical protein JCM17845_16920 [Iodidimonas gelatinilytica]
MDARPTDDTSLRQKQKAGASPEAVTRNDAETATAQIDRFGLPVVVEEDQRGNHRNTTVTSARKKLRGEWVLTLENGQIWEQTDRMRISTPRQGDDVTISENSVGNFFLTINGRSIRVTRIR